MYLHSLHVLLPAIFEEELVAEAEEATNISGPNSPDQEEGTTVVAEYKGQRRLNYHMFVRNNVNTFVSHT